MQVVMLSFTLGCFWLLWSGRFEPSLLFYGVLSVAGVVAVMQRLGGISHDGLPYRFVPRFIAYLPWLIWEIVKSNMQVAKIILDPKLPIHPELLRMPVHQRTEAGQVIYANSITLTPGTLTLEIRDGEVCVHALAPEFAEGLEEGEMSRRVEAIEGNAGGQG